MIVSFSVSNFRSIKDEVTLSFEPTNDEVKKTSQTYEVVPGVHLLRMAIIHGANASGKTNVLRALDFLSYFWRSNSINKNLGINIIPFMLPEDPNTNSIFELICYVGGTKMVYNLELNTKEVVKESLDYYASNQPSNAFTRTTVDGISVINFPTKMKVSAAVKELITLRCLPNLSVLSAYGQINAKIDILNEFAAWHYSYLFPLIFGHTQLTDWAKGQMHKHPEIKPFVLDFLQEADFNITDFVSKELVQTNIHDTVDFVNYELKYTHKVIDNEADESEHTLEEYLQSAGTSRLLFLAVHLYQQLNLQAIAFLDEIESSLHPYLLYYFIRRFLEEENNASQLIVTSHYDGLLNQTSWIDKDLFWFTEKKKDGSTDLYSLSDFKGLKRMSIQKAYLSGNFGALPEIDY